MSSNGQEIELKYRLCCEAPLALFTERFGAPVSTLVQSNYYYRSASAPELMVRLRREATLDSGGAESSVQWVLTVKGKSLAKQDGLFIRREDEARLSVGDKELREEERRVDVLRHHPLTGAFGDSWKPLGVLKNCRRVFMWEGLALELDQTHFSYLPEPEWELEVETTEPERDAARVKGLLADLGAAFVPQTSGKFSRFMQGIK